MQGARSVPVAHKRPPGGKWLLLDLILERDSVIESEL